MRRFSLAFALVAAVSLAACALSRPDASWADDVSERDAVQITAHIATLAAEHLPRGALIRLAPSAANPTGRAVASRLTKALQERGLRIADGEAPGTDAHALRYVITRYGEGLLLRVRIDEDEASTVLSRMRSGELAANAPLAIRKVSP